MRVEHGLPGRLTQAGIGLCRCLCAVTGLFQLDDGIASRAFSVGLAVRLVGLESNSRTTAMSTTDAPSSASDARSASAVLTLTSPSLVIRSIMTGSPAPVDWPSPH
jgi:hypothetical protein